MTSSRCQPIFGVASANSTNQRDFMRQESLQQRNKSKQFISGKEKCRSCRAGGEFFFLEVMSGPVCQHIEVFTNFWGRPNALTTTTPATMWHRYGRRLYFRNPSCTVEIGMWVEA